MSFTCQKCRQPLLLSPTLSSELDLNQSAYDLIQDSFIAHPHRSHPHRHASSSAAAAQLGHTPHAITTTSPSSPASPAATGTDAQGSLSARLLASSRLFDLLSHPHLPHASTSDPSTAIDHPLCNECTDALLEIMDDQMANIRKERDALLAFESECKRYGVMPSSKGTSDEQPSQQQQQQLQDLISQLATDEKQAKDDLELAESQRLSVEDELRALDQQERALQAEEESFWAKHSAHALEIAQLSSARSSLLTSLDHTRASLARLTLTNVYNDAFCIGHDGGFATINGLRLGRLPGANVEWNEINAAWGQTALLLSTLARKLDVDFQGWRILPKGSFSTVHRTDGDRAVYELYGSGDWQIGRLLQSRRFDHAMVGFLDCLKQLATWASQRDESLRLPHAINKDRIGEASIRLQFGQDETWTRALRHVLWTLKVLLSWTVQRIDELDPHPPQQAQRPPTTAAAAAAAAATAATAAATVPPSPRRSIAA
ncbi:uncharacterized protein PFL1_03309 [Pseudozyma flocculosa PF-1]|uniref:Related to Beclin 1 n=2 Tax=Pseudozyma flocculosa TaxID=84751 RepID=A0A5C3F669_9BASI|nr:uncharacterized protein PFL1_03309 [Pseudozyma flocculosa PF-1]EPQ29019.1 hypothetical protein PFL1_03309 [Pseudozyma flocculosa PF-1]SPO40013.1 related to Beclin 1 [Pseudozyma flocculosa]